MHFDSFTGASRRLYCPVTAVLFELCFLLLSRDICIVCQAQRPLKNSRTRREKLKIFKKIPKDDRAESYGSRLILEIYYI